MTWMLPEIPHVMISLGIPIVGVSKIFGHSIPSVTLNIYSHCVSEMPYKAAEVMEEIMSLIAIEMVEIGSKTGGDD